MEIKSRNDIPMLFGDIDVAEAFLFGVGVFKNGSWKSNEEREIICWMPLPEPPKEV